MFNVFSMVDNYAAVDKWVANLNKQAKGSIETAYKAERFTFLGGATTVRAQSPGRVFQEAEGSLAYQEHTDYSRGDISISNSAQHAAIAGEGWFLVTDGKNNFHYSRDGEFTRDLSGLLVNQSGLFAVDQGLAMGLPPASFAYTAPTNTVATIDGGTAGWQAGTASGPGTWYPYVPGTKYDEGGSYEDQSVLAKRSWFINNGNLTGSLTLSVGDLSVVPVTNPNAPPATINVNYPDTAFVVVNGQQLSIPIPTAVGGGGAVTINISQFLKPGANSIAVKATEFQGVEGLSLTGNVGGQAFNSTGWAYKISQTPVDRNKVPGYPTTPAITDLSAFGLSPDDWEAIYGNPRDLILVNGPTDKAEFEPTLYGNTVFSWPNRPAILPLHHPGTNGTGNLVFNALETSNVRIQQLAPEIAMAQQMYSNLKTILQLKKSNFDLMMAAVK
jgi:flagellar basal body rod protein FlgG